MKAAMPMRNAVKPVFMALVRANPAAAKDTSATGGVIPEMELK